MRLGPRASGILLHPTSLPGGRLGREAHRLIDWLAAAGQSWWQVLPLGPPDAGGSPYTSASAFAGSPALLAEPGAQVTRSERSSFEKRHAYWIGDWIEFAGRDALEDQVRFEREWTSLREYARRRGVRLFGDLPIYVAAGSADHLARPHLFQQGVVAGAPPDALSEEGQLWGHPLYDWPVHRAEGYRWWINRFRRTFELVDLTRIDHFRGFVAYWAVPEGVRTARRGRWRRGPGIALFRAAEAELGPLRVVAEDLGVITPAVTRLRDELGFPGMYVLQFGLGGGPRNPHRAENHPEHGVVYTGTHDTDTALGWWRSLSSTAREQSGLDPAEPHWSMIELALASHARLTILPAQDVLGLGSEARMNRPGVRKGSWTWRLEPGQLTAQLARRLRRLTEKYGRVR